MPFDGIASRAARCVSPAPSATTKTCNVSWSRTRPSPMPLPCRATYEMTKVVGGRLKLEAGLFGWSDRRGDHLVEELRVWTLGTIKLPSSGAVQGWWPEDQITRRERPPT